MNANLQTPLKRVRGLGSAKEGAHHFLVQRLTALALVPLAIWFIFLVLTVLHADYAQARAIVQQPFAATWLIAFVIVSFWHAQLGLQVIVEDYVHTRWLELATQIAIRFFCFAGALVSVLAIIRIAAG